MSARTASLRNLARDKCCMIRLPGCIGEPTVLAHYRLAGTCGVGMKPTDLAGAWACPHCHDVVDGRKRLPSANDYASKSLIRLAHAEGVMRTLAEVGKT